LLVLEEKGYITIGDRGIIYQMDYINNQLKRSDISEKELAQISMALEMIFGEGKTVPVVVTMEEVNALERIQLDIFMRIHKEELMAENEIETDEKYDRWREDSFIILELWQTEYRDLVKAAQAMSREEYDRVYPLGANSPEHDMVFLGQLSGFPLESRREIIAALRSEEGLTVARLEEILGRNDRSVGMSHAILSMS